MDRVQEAGGFFLLRAKAGMNPQVVEAWREDGTRLRSLRNKPLKAIHTTLPKRQRVERVVAWQLEAHPLRLRLLISWHRQTQEFCSLVTNLPATRYRLDMLSRAYTWRWQVALLFKEWKSYANLHAFDTENAAIELAQPAQVLTYAVAVVRHFSRPCDTLRPYPILSLKGSTPPAASHRRSRSHRDGPRQDLS